MHMTEVNTTNHMYQRPFMTLQKSTHTHTHTQVFKEFFFFKELQKKEGKKRALNVNNMQYLCVYCKPVHSHSLFLSPPHTCSGADEHQLCQHLKPEMNCWHLLHSANLTCPCTFGPLTNSHSAHFVPEKNF